MLCVRSLLLLSFLCVSVQAQSVVIVQGGRAWYVLDGSLIAVPADRLIRLAGGGPVDPPTDPPTDPPEISELERLSSLWPEQVSPYEKRDAHRQGLQATYSVLGTQAAEGKFSDLGQLQQSTVTLRDLVLGGDKLKWAEWYQPIGAYLATSVSSVAEAALAYPEISAGLEVEGEAIGPGWVKVIEFVIEALGEGALPPRMLALIKLLLSTLGG